jgi:hypothetical protein
VARLAGSGYSLSQQWRRKLEGEAVTAGEFDFEIALLHQGMASLPLERVAHLHPQARAELIAFLEAKGDIAKAREERWAGLTRK